MSKVDLRKDLKKFYDVGVEEPVIVEVPDGKFISITGRGEPGGPAYRAALGALYPVVFTLKFKSKARGKDFTVMTLESLWWWDDPSITSFVNAPSRDEWNWKSMIRVPGFVTDEMIDEVKREVKEKKGIKEVGLIVLETFREGLSAQIVHVGPYSEEEPTIRRLHGFIKEKGYRMRGRHHEIYMSDPRRVPPERWKTIIRQPMEKT